MPRFVSICVHLRTDTFWLVFHKKLIFSVIPQMFEMTLSSHSYSYIFFLFFQIIKRKLKIVGTEASWRSFEKAGILPRIPQKEKDALFIYEMLKTDSQKWGNVYMSLRQIQNGTLLKDYNYRINGV